MASLKRGSHGAAGARRDRGIGNVAPHSARRWRGRRVVALLSLALLATPVASNEPDGPVLVGRVVGVTDGDTLKLLVDGREVKVRLAQIDAPEMSQPYGARAKSALSELALGREARVAVIDIDDYGRTVGEVVVAGRNVNTELVRRGHAWAYTRYARSADIIAVEDEARAAQRGLWRLPESERDAPWVWRHERRRSRGSGGSRPARPEATRPEDWRCGAKRTCGEMGSCAEARFHHETCGLSRLDGDGDGVPCEKLCRP